jgi:hypothetical protein
MPAKLRTGKPAVAELIPEDEIAFMQLHDDKGKPLNEWVHWDPTTQKAVKGPKPTGKRLVPTGSMLQVDLHCEDCGAGLVAGGGKPFDYLHCGRMRFDPAVNRGALLIRVDELRPRAGGGMEPVEAWHVVDVPEQPTPGSVLECGRYGLL